jgi:hypothetical protein
VAKASSTAATANFNLIEASQELTFNDFQVVLPCHRHGDTKLWGYARREDIGEELPTLLGKCGKVARGARLD